MTGFAHAQLVALVSAGVVASCLLGAAAAEADFREGLATRSALDALAFQVASLACSPSHPSARIALGEALGALPASVRSVLLFPDHLRSTRTGGGTTASIEFPPLRLPEPLEILGAGALEIRYDPLEARCIVSLFGP